MPRCTNVECPETVRWDDHLGDGLWIHARSGERKCPLTGLTPPLSQRRDRKPGAMSWHCSECGTWVPVEEDGQGGLRAACIGPALRMHPEVTWSLLGQDEKPLESLSGPPEIRLSPDRRMVAIRTGEKRWAPWRSSDGTRRTDARVADWTVLPQPGIPAPRGLDSEPDEAVIEYGIEYRYTPERWHVLPSIVFTDPVAAAKAVNQRNRGRKSEDYRLVQRRAAGPWEPMLVTVG